ncbi:MAG TPA: TonB-dependent receptor, partial [Thermoanaerobaculia bacterium]|nr:TonB-dependent receptor [Thermoanaerobaculia bacterium]
QATLGGYILRDRLWFFGGYRTIPSTTNAFTTNTTSEAFTTTTTEDRWQFKIRGALTSSHTFDASYLEYDATINNRAGLPAGDLLATNGQRGDPRSMTSITYQGILGTSTFLDAMATDKNAEIISGGSPDAGDPFLWSTPGNWVYNNHWWDATDPSVRDNRTASVNLSHSLDGGGALQHMLQGGVQYVESTTAGDNRQSATGYNLFAFTQSFNPRMGANDVIFDLLPGEAQRWVATDLRAENEITNTALYLQDTIDWNRFRFDLGVRYDIYRGKTTGVQAFDLDFNDISPRIGVTYNVTSTVQLLGTYGKYVGRFNDNWAQSATGVSSAPREVYTYGGPALIGATRDQIQAAIRNDELWTLSGLVGDPSFPTTWVGNDTESPYTNEYNLSIRTALPRSTGFAALTYTNRQYENLMTAFVGLACTDFGLCEGAGDYAPLPGNRQTDTTVWTNDPRATRDYDALTLQLDYRPTGRMILGGNWTWSETKGSYEGEALNQPASGSPHGNREREFPIEFAAPYGYLNPHVEHRANLYTTYRFDFSSFGSLSTSAILNFETGRVWSRTASVPRSVETLYASRPTTTYVHFFDGRGNNNFDNVWSLDVAGRYSLPLFRGVAPFVKFSVANVTNNDTLTSFQTTGQAVPVTNADGTISHYEWAPTGNCGPADQPSRSCTGFGRIRGQQDYQLPRRFLASVGIQF